MPRTSLHTCRDVLNGGSTLLHLLGLVVTGGHDSVILVWTLDSLGGYITVS